jgi:hypothetical protein
MTNSLNGSQKFLIPYHKWPLVEPGSHKTDTRKIPEEAEVKAVFLDHMQKNNGSGSTTQEGGRT